MASIILYACIPIANAGPSFKVVYVDIKPGSWPNPINIKSKGVFAAAICGTEDFNVMAIDPTTVGIFITGIEVGVSPLRWSYEDAATPYNYGEPDCGGHDLTGDGYLDLVFHFDRQEVVIGLELADHEGETCVKLFIRGECTPCGNLIEGSDYVWVIDLPGDVNSDAVVNLFDAVILGLAWNSTPNPSPNWDPRADINEDNEVNILDAVVVSLNWGATP